MASGGEQHGLASGVVGLLTALCRELIDAPGAGGCAISRVIGDVLVEIAEAAPDDRRLQLGHGYLISDFPETQAVVESRTPRVVALADPDADAGEVRILEELGFGSVLMLPLVAAASVWALVELYRVEDGGFSDDEIEVAAATVRRFARLLDELLNR